MLSNKYVRNINRALKDIKSNIMADFIQVDNRGLIITTNKVTFTSNLNIVEKYIKNIDVVNLNNVMLPRLPQSKSYIKILCISYLIKDTNVPITTNIVEKVLQFTHIFNDIVLASKLYIIKESSKSDMAVI